MGCLASTERKIFGIPVVDVPRDDDQAFLPKIVVKCVEFVERQGNIDTNGIYRISANRRDLQNLIDRVRIEFAVNEYYCED